MGTDPWFLGEEEENLFKNDGRNGCELRETGSTGDESPLYPPNPGPSVRHKDDGIHSSVWRLPQMFISGSVLIKHTAAALNIPLPVFHSFLLILFRSWTFLGKSNAEHIALSTSYF